MNFLAIDTSAAHLTVIAQKGEKVETAFIRDSLHAHSVRLMDEIDGVLSRAGLSLSECELIASVVGAGSFTGIRIGIATVKGLCFASGVPALAVTSFDALAYAERGGKRLALVDAGHGYYYTCGYGEEREILIPPAYSSKEEAERLIKGGFSAVAYETLGLGEKIVDPAQGLLHAVRAKCGEKISPAMLHALYIRKSSAEENAK